MHRLLSLLKKKRLINADTTSQLYSLGPGVVELAWVLLRQQDLRTICHPHLERLRQAAMKRSACISAWETDVSASKNSKAVRTSNIPKPQGWRPPYMSAPESVPGLPAASGAGGSPGHPAPACHNAQYAHGPRATPGGVDHRTPAWVCCECRRTLAMGLSSGCAHPGLE